MWREETGFMEMFVTYYWQFHHKATSIRGYRDFLRDVLNMHEQMHSNLKTEPTSSREHGFEIISENSNDNDVVYAPDGQDVSDASSKKKMREKIIPSDPRNEEKGLSSYALTPVKIKEEPIASTEKKKCFRLKVGSVNPDKKTYVNLTTSSPQSPSERRRKIRTSNRQTAASDEDCQELMDDSDNFDNSGSDNDNNIDDRDEGCKSVDDPTVERRRFFCYYCDKVLPTATALQQHSLEHKGERPYACQKCPKAFKSRTGLLMHSRIHTGYRPFNCTECSNTYPSSVALQRHFESEHGKNSFKCKICDKQFKRLPNLLRHEALHRGERPFACIYCNKTFSQACYLRAHERTHTGDQPFKCTHCSKAFNNRTHCIAHMRTHTGDRPFVCDRCGSGFRMSWFLKRHMARCDPSKIKRPQYLEKLAGVRKKTQSSPVSCEQFSEVDEPENSSIEDLTGMTPIISDYGTDTSHPRPSTSAKSSFESLESSRVSATRNVAVKEEGASETVNNEDFGCSPPYVANMNNVQIVTTSQLASSDLPRGSYAILTDGPVSTLNQMHSEVFTVTEHPSTSVAAMSESNLSTVHVSSNPSGIQTTETNLIYSQATHVEGSVVESAPRMRLRATQPRPICSRDHLQPRPVTEPAPKSIFTGLRKISAGKKRGGRRPRAKTPPKRPPVTIAPRPSADPMSDNE